MTFDAARFQNLGRRLIDQLAFEAILRRTTYSGPAYNPTETTSDTTVRVLDEGNQVVGENQSANVAIRERSFLLPFGYIVPEKGDVLVVGSDEYEVIRVDTTSPTGIDIIYRLVMRT